MPGKSTLRSVATIGPLAVVVLGPALWLAGDAVSRQLVLTTLVLVGWTALIGLPPGCLLAVVLWRTDLPGRHLFRIAFGTLLFWPLYVQLAGWRAAFDSHGLATSLLGLSPQAVWLTGLPAAAWVHGLAAIPWVTVLVGFGLSRQDSELEDAARLETGPSGVLMRIVLRRGLPLILIALLWVLLSTAGEIVVTDIFQVRTYAEELFTGFRAADRETSAPLRVLPGVLFSAGLACAGWCLAASLFSPRGHESVRTLRALPLGSLKLPALGLVLVALFVVAGIPLAALVRTAGVQIYPERAELRFVWQWSHFGKMVAGSPWRQAPDFRGSLAIGGIAAAAAIALGTPLAWLGQGRRDRWRTPVVCLAAAGLALPGPVAALAAIWLLNRREIPFLADLYDHSLLAPCLVATVRALPLSLLLLDQAFLSLGSSSLEMARLDGAGWWRSLWSVALPQRRMAVWGAFLAALAAVTAEVGGQTLVQPPGVSTLGFRVLDEMHRGVYDQLAGLCLFLTGACCGCGLVVVWLVRFFAPLAPFRSDKSKNP